MLLLLESIINRFYYKYRTIVALIIQKIYKFVIEPERAFRLGMHLESTVFLYYAQ